MNSRSVISRFCSMGLVLVMMLGITPKSFLHELFAHHEDVIACNDAIDVQGPCIHKQGYNCEQTDLVVPSAFDTDVAFDLIHAQPFTQPSTDLYSSSSLNNHLSEIAGRGPPVHV